MKYLIRLLPIILLAGCYTPGILSPWRPVNDTTKQHVVIFGDSLTWDASARVIELYAQDPNIVLSHNSFGGTTAQDWIDEMMSVPAGSKVIVALGTNDVMLLKGDLDLWKAMEALNTLTSKGVVCIQWFTLNPTTASYNATRQAQTTEYNNVLQLFDAMNDRWPTLQLYDWASMSEGHTDWLNLPNDYVHHNAAGNEAYAQAQFGARTSC